MLHFFSLQFSAHYGNGFLIIKIKSMLNQLMTAHNTLKSELDYVKSKLDSARREVVGILDVGEW